MEEKAGDDEIVEEERGSPASIASASKNSKREAAVDGAPGADVCDDVLVSILARLPARTAISCMALSKHHRRLIRSPEFRSLHRRLSPPPPRPHVAYVATEPLRWKGERGLVSVFHGFHVAGAGIAGIDAAPMRALFGDRYLDDRYVNTCNGVVLLATNGYSRRGRCVLWNPAVADVVRDVTVPDPSNDSHYLVLGLGYGLRSQRYKLLLCRKDCHWETNPGGRVEFSLQVYVLGEQPRLRTVSSTGVTGLDGKIQSQESLYMDGVVFILDVDKSVIAFDVDDETIATIDLPGERDRGWTWHVRSTLMEMDGSLCLVTNLGDHHRAGLWLLTPDRQWELRCVIELQDDPYHREDDGSVHYCSISGVWDCGGGALALFVQGLTARNNRLCLYQLATEKMFDAKLPCDLVPECSMNYAICWGYKPTLVAPQSIVELSQDEERRRNNAAHVMEALKPIDEKDSREGRNAILDTVSFMEFLVSIMRKLPDDLQGVIKELALLESKDLDLVYDNDSEDSENAARDAEFEIVSGSEPDSD